MIKWFLHLILATLLLLYAGITQAGLVKGIYLTQSTLENTALLTYLIQRAKAVGIDTFIVDLERPSKKYRTNIALLKNNNISYVARIVVFPEGGTAEQVASESHREKKFALVTSAVELGAEQIQLDYIRYNTKQPPSSKNAENIFNIIRWFKDRLIVNNIPLQVDVFGISSFGESKYIGQNIVLFSKAVDVICPMVYPSHYEPYTHHATRPYETVFKSLQAIKAQFNHQVPIKLIPYIELSNYRYPLSYDKKLAYIYAQIQAAEDAGANGWYAWSPYNKYDVLFHVLETYPVK